MIQSIKKNYEQQVRGLFLGILSVFYTGLYEPWIFVSAVPQEFRLGVEACLLILFYVVYFFDYRVDRMIVWLLVLTLLAAGLYTNLIATYFSRLNKLLFFFLMWLEVRNNPGFQVILRKLIVILFTVITLQVIVSFVLYMFGMLPVSPHPFGFLSQDRYQYFGNPLFGQFLMKNWGSVSIPRACSYFFEPGWLAVLFGMLLIGAMPLRGWLRMCLLVALALTFSFSGWLSLLAGMACFLLIRLHQKTDRALFTVLLILMPVISFIILYFINIQQLFGFSSGGDRILRLGNAMAVWVSASPIGILLGSGIGNTGGASKAFTAGLLNLLVERGLLYMLLYGAILWRLVRNRGLLVYIIVANMAFDLTNWPIFYLLLVALDKTPVIIYQNDNSSKLPFISRLA